MFANRKVLLKAIAGCIIVLYLAQKNVPEIIRPMAVAFGLTMCGLFIAFWIAKFDFRS